MRVKELFVVLRERVPWLELQFRNWIGKRGRLIFIHVLHACEKVVLLLVLTNIMLLSIAVSLRHDLVKKLLFQASIALILLLLYILVVMIFSNRFRQRQTGASAILFWFFDQMCFILVSGQINGLKVLQINIDHAALRQLFRFISFFLGPLLDFLCLLFIHLKISKIIFIIKKSWKR